MSQDDASRRVDDEAFTLPIPSTGLLIRKTTSPSEALHRSIVRSPSSPPTSYGGVASEAAESHFSLPGLLVRNSSDARDRRQSTTGCCDERPVHDAGPSGAAPFPDSASTPAWPRQPHPSTASGHTPARNGSAKRRATHSPVRDFRARLMAGMGAHQKAPVAIPPAMEAQAEVESETESCGSNADADVILENGPRDRMLQWQQTGALATQAQQQQARALVVMPKSSSTAAPGNDVDGVGSSVGQPEAHWDAVAGAHADGGLASCRSFRADACTDTCGVVVGSPACSVVDDYTGSGPAAALDCCDRRHLSGELGAVDAGKGTAPGPAELPPVPPLPPWLLADAVYTGPESDAIAQLQAVVSGLSEPYQRYIRERALELTRIIDDNLQRQRLDGAGGVAAAAASDCAGVAAVTPSSQAVTAAAALVLAVATNGTQWPYSSPFGREVGMGGSGWAALGASSQGGCDCGASDGSGVRWLFHSPRAGEEGSHPHGHDGGVGDRAPEPCEQPSEGGYPAMGLSAGGRVNCAGAGDLQPQHGSRSPVAASVGSCTMCFGSVLGGSQVHKQNSSGEVTSGALSARAAAAAAAAALPHGSQPPAKLTPQSCVSSTSPSRQWHQQRRNGGRWTNAVTEASTAASSACSNARSSHRADPRQPHPSASGRSGASSCRDGGAIPTPRGMGGSGLCQQPARSADSGNVQQPISQSRGGQGVDLLRVPSTAFEVSYLGRRTSYPDEPCMSSYNPEDQQPPTAFVAGIGAGVSSSNCRSLRTSAMQQHLILESSVHMEHAPQHLRQEEEEEKSGQEQQLQRQQQRRLHAAESQLRGVVRPTASSSISTSSAAFLRAGTYIGAGSGKSKAVPAGHAGGPRQEAYTSGSFSQSAWQRAQRDSMDPGQRASLAQRASMIQRRDPHRPALHTQYGDTNNSINTGNTSGNNGAHGTRPTLHGGAGLRSRAATTSYQQLLLRSGIGGPAGGGNSSIGAAGRHARPTSPGRRDAGARSRTEDGGYNSVRASVMPAPSDDIGSTSNVPALQALDGSVVVSVDADAKAVLAASAVARMLAASHAADSDATSDVLWGSVAPSLATARLHYEHQEQSSGHTLPVMECGAGQGASAPKANGERQQQDWQPLHTAFKLGSLITSFTADGGSSSTAAAPLPHTAHPESRPVAALSAGMSAGLAPATEADRLAMTRGAQVPQGLREDGEPATGFVIVSRRNTQNDIGGGAIGPAAAAASLVDLRSLLPAQDVVQAAQVAAGRAGSAAAPQDASCSYCTTDGGYQSCAHAWMPEDAVYGYPDNRATVIGGAVAPEARPPTRQALRSTGYVPPGGLGAGAGVASGRRLQVEAERLVLPDKEQIRVGSPARPRYGRNAAVDPRALPPAQSRQPRPKHHRATGAPQDAAGEASRATIPPRAAALAKGPSPGAGKPKPSAGTAAGRRPTSNPSGPSARAAAAPGLRSRSSPHIRPTKQPSRFVKPQPKQQQQEREPARQQQPSTPLKPPSSPPPPLQSQTPVQLQQTGGSSRSRWRLGSQDGELEDSGVPCVAAGVAAAVAVVPGYVPCTATSPGGSPTTPACRRLHVHSPEDMPLSAAAQHNFQARLAAVDTFMSPPSGAPLGAVPLPVAITTATTTAGPPLAAAVPPMHVLAPGPGLGLGLGLTLGPAGPGPKINSPAGPRPLPPGRGGSNLASYGSAIKSQFHKQRANPVPLPAPQQAQLQASGYPLPIWRPAAGAMAALDAATRTHLSSSPSSPGDSAAVAAASPSPPRPHSSIGLQDSMPNILSPPRNYDRPWAGALSESQSAHSQHSPSRHHGSSHADPQRQSRQEQQLDEQEQDPLQQEEVCSSSWHGSDSEPPVLEPPGPCEKAVAAETANAAARNSVAAAPAQMGNVSGGMGDSWAVRYGYGRASDGAGAVLLSNARRSGGTPRKSAAMRGSYGVGQGRGLGRSPPRRPLGSGVEAQAVGGEPHASRAVELEAAGASDIAADLAASADAFLPLPSLAASFNATKPPPHKNGGHLPDLASVNSTRAQPPPQQQQQPSLRDSIAAAAGTGVPATAGAAAVASAATAGSLPASSSNRVAHALRSSKEGNVSAREATGYTGLMLARQQLQLQQQQQMLVLQQQKQQHSHEQRQQKQEPQKQEVQKQAQQEQVEPLPEEPFQSLEEQTQPFEEQHTRLQQEREQRQPSQQPRNCNPEMQQEEQLVSARQQSPNAGASATGASVTGTPVVANPGSAAAAAAGYNRPQGESRRCGDDAVDHTPSAPCRATEVPEPSDGAGTALYGGARRNSDSGSESMASVEGVIAAGADDDGGRGSDVAASGRWAGGAAGRSHGPPRTASAGSGGAQMALLRQAAWPGLREPRVVDALSTLEAGIAVLEPIPPPSPAPQTPPSRQQPHPKPSASRDHADGVAAMSNGCFAIFQRSASSASARAAAAAAAAATPATPPPTHGSVGQRPVLLRMRVADGAVELLLLRPRAVGLPPPAPSTQASQRRGGGAAAAGTTAQSPVGPQRIRVAALSGIHPPLTADSSRQQLAISNEEDLADPASRWLQLVAMDGAVLRLSACSPADHARLVLALNAGLLLAAGGVGEEAPLAAVPLRGLLPMPRDNSNGSGFGSGCEALGAM